MKIAYRNEIDLLTAGNITVSSEAVGYDKENLQDQRLEKRWRTTSAGSEYIWIDSGDPYSIHATLTNVVSDPEDLNGSAWSGTDSSVYNSGYYYESAEFWGIEATATGGNVYQDIAASMSGSSGTLCFTARKGYYNTATEFSYIKFYEDGTALYTVNINFTTRSVTLTAGSISARIAQKSWVDDQTVDVAVYCSGITGAGTAYVIAFFAGLDVWEYTEYTRVAYYNGQIGPYYKTGAAAAAPITYSSYYIPNDGVFTIDLDCQPLFDTSADVVGRGFLEFLGTDYFIIAYLNGLTGFKAEFSGKGIDGVTYTVQYSFLGVDYAERIRLVVSFNGQNFSSENSFAKLIKEDGTIVQGTVVGAFSSPYAVRSLAPLKLGSGTDLGVSNFIGNISHCRMYSGNVGAFTDQKTLDSELAKLSRVWAVDYRKPLSFDTLALIGHNLASGNRVFIEANDYDLFGTDARWTDGEYYYKGVMPWNESIFIKYADHMRKSKIRFTFENKNSSHAFSEFGRLWVGNSYTFTPASLADFQVEYANTDIKTYGMGRQKYADQGVLFKRYRLAFPRTNYDGIREVESLYQTVGLHTSFIFCNFDSTLDYPLVYPSYVSIAEPLSFGHIDGMAFEYSLVLEEDK